MKQAIPLFGEEFYSWTPREGFSIRAYRCSACDTRFDMEQGYAAPRCCPSCGTIYELSPAQLADQLYRCAKALNMTPTTLLWILQASIAALQDGSVR